jgi:uncharacterized membrane protein
MDYISKTSNKELMAQARGSLKGFWGLSIGVSVFYFVILIFIQSVPIFGPIAGMLISGAMQLGIVIFSLALSRSENPQFAQIFDGFKKFGVALAAYFLQAIFVFLWSLLLIIPGIIASLSYAMTYYIIAEDDSIGPLEAIKKSKEIMLGNKWKLFCLGCRFIGWVILCIPTLGIGLLWVFPYTMISYAKFYDDILQQKAI